VSGSGAIYAIPADVNGDGRMDLFYPVFNASGVGTWWYALGNSSGTYGAPVSTGIQGSNVVAQFASVMPIDYNSDGLGDILVPSNSGQWQILRSTGSGFTVVSTSFSAPTTANRAWVTDVNGDGRQDLVYLAGAINQNNTLTILLNSASGFVSGGTSTPLGTNAYFNAIASLAGGGQSRSAAEVADFNSDGLWDLLVSYSVLTGSAQSGFSTEQRIAVLASTGSGYALSGSPLVTLVQDTAGINGIFDTLRLTDFNADGVVDVLYQCPSTGTWCVRFGTGLGIGAQISTGFSAGTDKAKTVITDWNGDGGADALEVGSNGNWHVMRSTGEVAAPLLAPLDTGVPTGSPQGSAATDVNGDGLLDLQYLDSSNAWRYRLHKAPFPDLVSAVTDGFGNTVGLQYAPMTDSSVYTKGAAAAFPDMSVQIPLYVVKQYSSSDGIGGTYAVTNSYSDARINLHGRGYLGFASRTEVDSRTGIRSNWTYRQDFPFVGQAAVVTVSQPGGSPTISQITNTYLTSTFGTGFNQRWFPFLYQSLERTYEVGGTANGQQISEVTTTNGFDTYGNHTSSVVVTRDPVSGQQFETHKSAMFLTDEPSWCVSLVTQQDETRYLPNLANQHRVTSYTPDANYSRCRVQRKTVEPFTPAWTVTTDYGYDATGNITSETVAATGITNRVTTRDFGPRKVLPVTMTNAAGETTTATYDFALGTTLTGTDPNGITTSYQYDSFGRKTRENRPDGTASTWTRYTCSTANGFCGDSLLRYQIIEQQLDSGANLIRHATERFDSMGRPKYQELQTLSGASTVVRVHYDNQGRVQQRSQPHFAGFNPYYTTFGYDLIGRPILEQRQVSETDTSLQSLQTTYARFTHSMIDANSKTITKLMNAIGQTVQMTDAASGVTQYEYDPFGNLTKTIDPVGNQSTAFFNIRGFKMSASDPDMGNWSFDYFPTGELKSQTDAIPRTVTFTYDGVSRPLTRIELEGTTQWTYGTSVANKNVGKLVSVTAPGSYSESFTYDSLGRSNTVTTNADSTSFLISNTYSTVNGLLETVTYPTSTTAVPGSRFKVQYEYAFGLLQRVRDFNSPSVIYWERMATDAGGRSIDERFGNALHTYTTYDNANGFLGTRVTGASAQVQNLTYSWDKMGNLTERKDVALSLTERFFYDNLYRLDYSTLNNVTNLDLAYDSIGNITSKSDVGSYTYHATKKHAVVSAGSQSFGYDANGNMTSRKGSAITWSSYNLPLQINEGSNSAQFSYGPSRARYKQVAVTAAGGPLPAGTETTIYIGGFFEKVTKPSAVVEYKHYVMAGEEAVALRTLRSNSVNDTRYLHKDHLGGVDAITDETGAVALKLSFDAFGKRRSPTSWSGAPSSGNWTTIAATTHRGFTFHEGLDNVGLVHMNGRAYDPTIGRFISADPHVQDVTNSQMLNRYSYVTNNPLSYTDPSGFFLKKLFKKIGSFLKKYWRPILAIVAAVVVGVWVYNAYMAAASKAALAAANAAISAAADASIAASIYTSSMATAGLHAAVLSGAAAGFVGGAIASGSLKGALVGALSGAAFGLVSGFYGNTWNVQRVLADGVAGGFSAEIGGGKFGEGFAMALGFSAANWAARTMREKMWDSSLKNPANSSGSSMGFEGDGRRLGGCRAPCDYSPLGGVQGKDPAYLISKNWGYSPGSWADGLVEAYSGPHDWLNSHFFYDAMGNNRTINGWVTQKLGTVLNAANVVVATPFVLASTSPGSFYGYLAGK
jgi:RHS repeat-associated protein